MSNELGFTYKDEVLEIIDGLELGSKTDNSILNYRFLSEVLNYEKRKHHTRKYYNIFRFVVNYRIYPFTCRPFVRTNGSRKTS